MNNKSIIVALLKIALAATILYWMINSGKIDINSILYVSENPVLVSVSLFLIFLLYVPMAFRWYLLLNAQKINTDFRSVLSLTYNGAFFGFIPY